VRSVELLVEMQRSHTIEMKKEMRDGFDRIVQCFSQKSATTHSFLSPMRHDFSEEVIGTGNEGNEDLEHPITVELRRPDGKPQNVDISSVKRIFENLEGKERKTEKAMDLIRLFVAAAWVTQYSDEFSVIFPFLL
jgi:hypothetical protein